MTWHIGLHGQYHVTHNRNFRGLTNVNMVPRNWLTFYQRAHLAHHLSFFLVIISLKLLYFVLFYSFHLNLVGQCEWSPTMWVQLARELMQRKMPADCLAFTILLSLPLFRSNILWSLPFNSYIFKWLIFNIIRSWTIHRECIYNSIIPFNFLFYFILKKPK